MKKIQNLITAVLMICIISHSYVFALSTEKIYYHWAFTHIKTLINNGVLNNVSDISYLESAIEYSEFLKIASEHLAGLFENDISSIEEGSFITREKACDILASRIESDKAKELIFNDTSSVSKNMLKSLEKLNYYKIIDGYPDGSFRPHKIITRAEAFKLINKVKLLILKDDSNFDKLSGPKNQIHEVEVTKRKANNPQIQISVEDSTEKVLQQEDVQLYHEKTALQDIESEYDNSVDFFLAKKSITSIQPDDYPNIMFTASMGSRFRSIDVHVTVADDKDAPQIFYLALETGSPLPDVNTIVHYANQPMLQSGEAVRGKWAAKQKAEMRGITLYGGESIDAAPKDLGFIDGYNYDLYMVARDGDGNYSNIASATNIMAMPFYAAHLQGKTFTIKNLGVKEIESKYPDLSANDYRNKEGVYKTARQLENIQRLASLYYETDGKHGGISFLTDSGNTYILAEDINLEYYMKQNLETGWKPIGNVDEKRSYIFSGKFEGNNKKITNLYIDKNADLYGDDIGYQGLFGRIDNAVIRNLILEKPMVIAKSAVVSTTIYAGIGSLVGQSSNSTIENITVNTPKILAYSTGENNKCAVGGLVGSGINTSLTGIKINSLQMQNYDLTNNKNGYADVAGGVIGQFYNYSGGVRALNNIFVSGLLKSNGKALGGVVGTIDSVGDETITVYAQEINSIAHLNGKSMFVGGIAGNIGYEQLLSPKTTITFDQCYASGSMRGTYATGGLFGKINSSVKSGLIVKNSASEADIVSVSANGSMGGFVGFVNTGSFENCTSVGGGITSTGDNTGGFAGEVLGNTDFIRCMTNRNIHGKNNVGGFAGIVSGNSYFESSNVRSGNVTAEESNVGGFVGIQDNGYVLFNNCETTANVYGQENVGQFIGFMQHGKLSASKGA